MTATEVRQKAAEIIETKGWYHGLTGPNGVCLLAAIDEAAFGERLAERRALSDLCEEIGTTDLATWNDRPERTRDEVLAALRGQS